MSINYNLNEPYSLDEIVDKIIDSADKGYIWRTIPKPDNPLSFYHYFYHPELGTNPELKKIIDESGKYLRTRDFLKYLAQHPVKFYRLVKSLYKMREPELKARYDEKHNHNAGFGN